MSQRILIYTTAYYPFVGGAEVAIREITERLTEYDFELVTALMNRKLLRLEKIGKVTVHRIGWGLPKLDKIYLAFFGHLKGLALHRKHKFNLVWAVMASFGGLAATKFKEESKIKLLLSLQEGDPTDQIVKKAKLIKSKFHNIFNQADGLQSISNYLANWGKEMGFKGSVAEVVPNGVDVDLFTKNYSENEVEKQRQDFGFSNGSIIIVTASRLVEKNGLEYVLRALALLPQNYCFVICGQGQLEKSLKKITGNLGLSKRVLFFGLKSHLELSKIFKACDIFIRPSITEGLGNAFLEAMASGLPTIGTLVGGITDFLEDGQTGIVCQPKDQLNISKALKQAGEMSAEEKERIHQNCLKIINNQFNWKYISGRMNNIFKHLANY